MKSFVILALWVCVKEVIKRLTNQYAVAYAYVESDNLRSRY